MNRTQKGAWFTLGVAILAMLIFVLLSLYIPAPGDRSTGVRPIRLLCWVLVLFVIGGALLVRRRQSPDEPVSDERDDLIRKNAILVCFISVWVALAAASIIPAFVVGDVGSIPVAMLPLIHMGVLLTALLVYSTAVLIQYQRPGKGGQP